MISWTDVNSMQKQKMDLQLELNKLLNSNDKSADKINELRAEILYLDKQITKILGSKELARQDEIRRKKTGLDERNIKNYFAFKQKYKKICNMQVSISRLLSSIENTQRYQQLQQDVLVKVR